jgi:hypothetical protein
MFFIMNSDKGSANLGRDSAERAHCPSLGISAHSFAGRGKALREIAAHFGGSGQMINFGNCSNFTA